MWYLQLEQKGLFQISPLVLSIKLLKQILALATVLMLIFTLTENVDLLNLHFRQQHPKYKGENKTHETGWMIALAKAMTEQLRSEKVSLYSDEENTSDEDEADLIAKKTG